MHANARVSQLDMLLWRCDRAANDVSGVGKLTAVSACGIFLYFFSVKAVRRSYLCSHPLSNCMSVLLTSKLSEWRVDVRHV